MIVACWRCGKALDLRLTGRGFKSQPFRFHVTYVNSPCIPPGSLNQVPDSAWGKGGIHTSAGWQVALCDHMECE